MRNHTARRNGIALALLSGSLLVAGCTSSSGPLQNTADTGIAIPDIQIASETIPDGGALAFVAAMKIGWNLGNTLDACADTNTLSSDLAYETSWGCPKTTQAMIDAVKAAGFNTVRIPVSWHNHVTKSVTSYAISSTWMARVKEVVDYAYGRGMYVILNIHHDNSTSYLYPTTAYLTQSENYVTSIWGQIATAFASYDNRLVFEGMNEPRMVGSTYEWWLDMDNTSCVDAVNCVNTLNQDFVTTVRASTGNNPTRYLMVPGYAASPSSALLSAFTLPTDTVSNRLIVSAHAYTPYSFALQAATESGSVSAFSASSLSSTSAIDDFLGKLYTKFVSKGIPVVIGEFGARDKDNLQSRVDFAAYYICAARARGITCCWWDNNGFSGTGENFGLLKRSDSSWPFPDIVTALMQYAPSAN